MHIKRGTNRIPLHVISTYHLLHPSSPTPHQPEIRPSVGDSPLAPGMPRPGVFSHFAPVIWRLKAPCWAPPSPDQRAAPNTTIAHRRAGFCWLIFSSSSCWGGDFEDGELEDGETEFPCTLEVMSWQNQCK